MGDLVLDLGHSQYFSGMAQWGDRLVSQDAYNKRRLLWDTVSRTVIDIGAYADSVAIYQNLLITRKGDTVDFRDASTGSLNASASATGIIRVGIGEGGGYVWALLSGAGGLVVWSPSGQPMLTVPGDYTQATIHGAATDLRIAKGPAGTDRIEIIPVDGSAPTLSATFSQPFAGFTLDAERFFAIVGSLVWVYDKDGTQLALFSFATPTGMGGLGDILWAYPTTQTGLDFYTIAGGNTPFATFAYGTIAKFAPSKSSLAVYYSGGTTIDIIHIGLAPTKTVETVPIKTDVFIWGDDDTLFSVFDYSKNAIFRRGTTVDPSAADWLGCGKSTSRVGSLSGRAAIATELQILVYDLSGPAPILETIIPSPAAQGMQLSDDGSVLIAPSPPPSPAGLTAFAMPSGAVINTWPGAGGAQLARGGGYLGFQLGNQRMVQDIAGQTTIFSDTVVGSKPTPIPSPTGTTVAATEDWYYVTVQNTTTRLYQNGALVNAVYGEAAGWFDDDKLLIQTYIPMNPPFAPFGFIHSYFYDGQGNLLGATLIPQLKVNQFTILSPTTVVNTSVNAYDATTGLIWSTVPYGGPIAGNYVLTGAFGFDGLFRAPHP